MLHDTLNQLNCYYYTFKKVIINAISNVFHCHVILVHISPHLTCLLMIQTSFITEHVGLITHLWKISTLYRVRTVMKNLEKSWNFKTAFSRPGKVLEKWINPESFGKVMEIYFTNLCIIQLCLFRSWISVRDCAWALSHISTLSRSFRI